MNTKYFFMILGAIFIFNGILFSQEEEASPEYGYIGTKGCKKCHLKQARSWEQTKMAQAYDLLKPGERADAKKSVGLDPEKDYTKDSECLPCHTTGYGKPGGFVSLEKTPELAGVGCEMCHGAGSEYTQEQYMSLKNKEFKLAEVVKAGLISPITGETCTTRCHNEKSPFFKKDQPFNFKERKEHGTHEHFALKYKHD